jgi:hypothetical protein
MKKGIGIFFIISLLPLQFFWSSGVVEAGGTWGYANSSASVSSTGNKVASGSDTVSSDYEIVEITGLNTTNGMMSASFSGKMLYAKWSGGTGNTSSTVTWYTGTSNTYCGTNSDDTVCKWSKTITVSGADPGSIQITSAGISLGTYSISGATVYYTGKGAQNSNTLWNYQDASAYANTGGSTVSATAGYGVTADSYDIYDYAKNEYASAEWHACSDNKVWTKVKAGPKASSSTPAKSWAKCQFQQDWFYYTGDASYKYSITSTSTTYDYSGTIYYKYRYWIPNNPPTVDVYNDSPSPLYRGTTVNFWGVASDSDGTIAGTSWSGLFSGAGSTRSYTTSTLGSFTAYYTATDDTGDSTTASSTIRVVNKPPAVNLADDAPSPLYRGTTIHFKGSASDDDGYITEVSWSGAISGTGYEQTYTTSSVGSFNVTFGAKDNDGGTSNITKSYTVVNRSPSVQITFPTGTATQPSAAKSPFDITWEYKDADSDPQQQYRLVVKRHSDNYTILDTGNVRSSSDSYRFTTPLPDGVKYRVILYVYDGFAWSQSAATYFITNRPPTASFTWSPDPVWEGDFVTLFNESRDPDGDALTYAWSIQEPNGAISAFSTVHVSSTFSQPGDYVVTLTASDGIQSSTITKNIGVSQLTLRPEVNHTPQWLSNHKASGHNVDTVPKDFYSGEIFMVEAETSPYPVNKVTAWMDTFGEAGNPLYLSVDLIEEGSPTYYKAELFDDRLMSMKDGLPEGLQYVYFQIEYSNGVIKRESIPVMIIGNVNKAVGVHRMR